MRPTRTSVSFSALNHASFAVVWIALSFIIVQVRVEAEEEGLINRWEFSSTKIVDKVVRPEAGTLNARVIGEVSFSEDRPSVLSLDGKTSRVLISDDLSEANLPQQKISVEAWVAVDKQIEWGGIIGAIQDNGSFERGWLLGYRQSRFCFAVASESKKRLTYMTADEDFSLGSWYHVVGTYDGERMKLYIDGRLVKSSQEQSGDILYPPNAFFEIGAYHDDNEMFPMQGRIAEVGTFDRALSDKEVQRRFDRRKPDFPGVEPSVEVVNAWPTYMHDNARTGITSEDIKLPLKLAWTYRARHAPKPAWPPPANQDFWHGKTELKARVTYDRAFHVVSDGKFVYFGSSADDKVYCLDLSNGTERWAYYTEGPVRLAPTLWEDRLYFGSDDGVVYCLNAKDGKLLWKHRAIEADRRIPGNGRMISAWPIRSGVIVENGQARFAAGLFPTQGTYQFALDAKSGKELAKAKLTFSPQGYIERRGGSLLVSQGRAPKAFLAKLKRTGKTITESLGKLPDEFPYAFIGVQNIRFAGGENKVVAIAADDGEQLWSAKVNGKAHSLAVAGGGLLVGTDHGVIHCFRHAAESATVSDAIDRIERVDASTVPLASQILAQADTMKGYCLVIGCGDGHLTSEIARQSQLKVIGVESDSEKVANSRRFMDRCGLAGQVSIHQHSVDKLPYGSALFNLIVMQPSLLGGQLQTPAKEVNRMLRPGGGVAVIGTHNATSSLPKESVLNWASDIDPKSLHTEKDSGELVTVKRPPLTGAGKWTHMYGDAGNTSCSGDERVGGSFSLQWFGPPGPQQMIDRHHRTVPPLYTAGRLFIPGNNRVIAVDAYNGTILWNEETEASRRVAAMRDAGSMSATEDILYVAAKEHCLGLNVRTGERQLRFNVPSGSDGQARHWGYVAGVGDRLFGTGTKLDASRSGHSRRQIDGTYWDFVPIVTSDSFFCMDRQKGTLNWHYECESGAVVNPTITIGGDRVYFIESTNKETLDEPSGRSKLSDLLGKEAQLVALDIESGAAIWRKSFDFSEIQHHLYLCYSKEKLVAVGTKNRRDGLLQRVWYDLHGFSATTGEHIWSQSQNQGQGINGDHGEQDHHPVIVGDIVYQEPRAYDLHTGKPQAEWKFARRGHGCGTISASNSAFFFRAGNPTMCDLTTGKKSKITEVSRPGCWINVIPAGGLLLIPEASSGCTCNFAIQSSMAFMPE